MTLQIENKKLLDGVSFASSQTSVSDAIYDALAFSVQFIWSGATAAAGDLIVEGSNDDSVFVPVSTTSITGETTGSALINVERAGYSFVRVRWVRSAGSGGTLTVYLSSKRQ